MSDFQNYARSNVVLPQSSTISPLNAEASSALRKHTPSPLQVAHNSIAAVNEASLNSSPHAGSFVDSPKATSSSSYSPRSPRYSPGILKSSGNSLGSGSSESIASTNMPENRDHSRFGSPVNNGPTPFNPRRDDMMNRMRKISAPVKSSTVGFYPSPSEMPPPLLRNGPGSSMPRIVPRTSSIDSTMSTTSSTTNQSQRSALDLLPSAAEVQQCIALHGSPESAVQQLLREKKKVASQFQQLWGLVDKQRALVVGLNKDLERALRDKDRYERKYKECLAQQPPLPRFGLKAPTEPAREDSTSPSLSEDQDDLPIQRHSGLIQPEAQSPNLENGPSSLSNTAPSFITNCAEEWASQQSNAEPALQKQEAEARSTPDLDDDISPKTTEPSIVGSSNTVPNTSIVKTTPPTKDVEAFSARNSFTARRSIISPRKSHESPILGGSPPMKQTAEFAQDTLLSARKKPPAPLNLNVPKDAPGVLPAAKSVDQLGPEDHSGSEYDVDEVDEIPPFIERGRRKTREDDDREREVQFLKEQEIRSLSRRSKGPKSPKSPKTTVDAPPTPTHTVPLSPAMRAISPTYPPQTMSNHSSGHLSPPASLIGLLKQQEGSKTNSLSDRSVSSPFPLSPGLPASPRPGAARPPNVLVPRPPRENLDLLNSPPLSPRPLNGNLVPLSSRSPRYPIPLPPHTPVSVSSPLPVSQSEGTLTIHNSSTQDTLVRSRSDLLDASGNSGVTLVDAQQGDHIYRGLVDEVYPGLLLPPNALPSIRIKVASSRLKPSRHSTLALKGPEEEPVFTLAIMARSNDQQLWRVEKVTMSLPPLDKQLKQASAFSTKLPDRSLFIGHAPAKIDMRRMGLEGYFEAVLDTPMDENAALIVCKYLSSDVIEPSSSDALGSDVRIQSRRSSVAFGPGGREMKEGYLTKRGKNFGGWKARFFVLDDPILRYYESPGGTLLGTIKLHNAQIGRQTTQHKPESPSGIDELDNNFRHAFLIMEPKAKDASKHVRHVLCAESDIERDQWVEALLQYVALSPDPERPVRPPNSRNPSSQSKLSILQSSKRINRKEDTEPDIPENESTSLHGLSYENTVPAQPPIRVAPMPPVQSVQGEQNLPSPTSQTSKTISSPLNGAVIRNTAEWGNRPLDSPKFRDKEQPQQPKKRSLWGFRDRPTADGASAHSTESVSSVTQHNAGGRSRDVFGIALAEAVNFAPPRGLDVCLPAVVYRCLEYLEARNVANEEGIFRIGGSNLVIKALRERFTMEGDVDLCAEPQAPEISAVASLLKQYLRELPTIILTRELHLEFLAVLGKLIFLPPFPSSFTNAHIAQNLEIRPARSPPTTDLCTGFPFQIGPS